MLFMGVVLVHREHNVAICGRDAERNWAINVTCGVILDGKLTMTKHIT